MAVIVARATDAVDEAVLEALGFNAFARDLAEAVHDMAAADADEAVLEALGFNAFARELGETVRDMAALDADDEAALAMGDFAHQLPPGIVVIRDLEEADADEEAIIEDIVIEAADEEEEPALLDAMEFDAIAGELDIHEGDKKVIFVDDLYYDEILRAIDRALEEQREEASASPAAAAMPRHVACC